MMLIKTIVSLFLFCVLVGPPVSRRCELCWASPLPSSSCESTAPIPLYLYTLLTYSIVRLIVSWGRGEETPGQSPSCGFAVGRVLARWWGSAGAGVDSSGTTTLTTIAVLCCEFR
jgi:hypothetical protein